MQHLIVVSTSAEGASAGAAVAKRERERVERRRMSLVCIVRVGVESFKKECSFLGCVGRRERKGIIFLRFYERGEGMA
jgi:hypothetical protein